MTDWRKARDQRAQVSVPEAQMVNAVREVLERQKPFTADSKPTKYQIQIERLHDAGPNQWEWRVFADSFDEPAITGGDGTAAGALYEAICYVRVEGFDEEFTVHSRSIECR